MMNLRTQSILTLTMALLFAASTAIAQTPRFDELDGDGNGYISASEARAVPCLSQNFNDIEKESDRGLSRSEFTSAVQKHCGDSMSEGESDWPQL